MVKDYAQLAKLGVFSMTDATAMTGNVHTARTMVARFVERGLVRKIRSDMYAAVDLATGGVIPSKFRIACAINNSAYLTHHTAFEYYGLTNQVYYEVYAASVPKFDTFEFEGITYKRVAPKIDVGIVEPPNTIGIRVTDLERTVVDSINDIERIGGFEELLNCLSSIPYLDEIKLKIYLDAYKVQGLYQKTGYLLEHFMEELQLSREFIEYCRSQIENSTRYFLTKPRNGGVYVKEWKLIVPEGLFEAAGYGGGLLV